MGGGGQEVYVNNYDFVLGRMMINKEWYWTISKDNNVYYSTPSSGKNPPRRNWICNSGRTPEPIIDYVETLDPLQEKLYKSVSTEDVSQVNEILELSCDVNFEYYGETPLHIACKLANYKIIKKLLENEATITFECINAVIRSRENPAISEVRIMDCLTLLLSNLSTKLDENGNTLLNTLNCGSVYIIYIILL